MKDFTIRRAMQFTQNAYKTLAVIICFSYSFQTNAQSGQKWATDGNTLKDSTEFLGTKNNFHLTFKTNGFERMRLTNAGNLGIGVWYPTSLLTVGGFIESTTGGFKFPDGTVQTTAANFTGNVTDTIVISKTITIQNDVVVENNMNVGNTIQVGDSSMYMGKTKQGTSNSLWTDNGDLYIQSSPDYNFNTIINYNNTGKVGIGTTSLTSKFNVTSNTSNIATFYYFNGSTNPRLHIKGTANNNINLSTGYTTGPAPALSFGTYSAPEALFIKEDGKIGINKNAPVYNLDVAGTINATNYLQNGNALTSSQWLTTGSNISYTNGNVGIGTTTPETQLDIVNTGSPTSLLRVYGQGSSNTTQPDLTPFTFATFIQSDNSKADAGIRIQGARTHNDRADIAFIDLANFDNDNTGAYIMSRIAGGLMDQDPTPGPPTTPAQTNDRGYLKFYTNAGKPPYGTGEGLMERMRITDLGLVGIGTSTPTAKLSVYQNNLYQPALSITKEIPAASPYGNLFEITKKVTGTSTTEYVFVVRDTGRVGIGTDNPTDKLTVVGTIASTTGGFKFPDGTMQTTAANTTNIFNTLTVNNKLQVGTSSVIIEDITNPLTSTHENHIYTNTGDLYLQSSTVNPSGNVGVGTTNPQAKLDVSGKGLFNQLSIYQGGYGSSQPTLSVTKSMCDPIYGPPGGGACVYGNIFEVKKIISGSSSTPYTAFVVQDTGYVGIGVDDPSDKLEVKGVIRIARTSSPPTTSSADGLRMGIHYRGGTNYYSWLQSYTPQKELSLNPIGGNVGIGTTNPQEKLEVRSGNILIKGTNNFSANGDEAILFLGDNNHYIKSVFGGGLRIGTYQASDAIMLMQSDGKVIIGNVTPPTTSHPYKLFVEGGILAEKIKSAVKTSTDWSDDVFQDDYKLMSIGEVEQYIKKNKHLPSVPSAEQVVESGVDMVKMDATLLRKIEELTLYTIEQQKQIEELKRKMEELKCNGEGK